jgi:steroid delta-isomerase-like uncharacterized protein
LNNKRIAQEFHDRILNQCRYEEAERLVCDDVVFSLNQNEPLVGIDAFSTHMTHIQKAFPNLTYRTESIIEEDGVVVLHWIAIGTHTKPLGEIAPTRKDLELKGLSLFRFNEDRISENIVYFNETEIPKQLGILP